MKKFIKNIDIYCDGADFASMNNLGKSLEKYSIKTVKSFYDDAKKAGYKL